MQINYEDALRVIACYLSVGGPPTVTEYNKARTILWPCLTAEQRSERVLR